MKTIYLIEAVCGSYDDRTVWIECAYLNKTRAEEACELLNKNPKWDKNLGSTDYAVVETVLDLEE
jgi:hypothetical protein